MKKGLKGVIALTVLGVVLLIVDRFIPITSPLSSDMGTPFAYLGIFLLIGAAAGIGLLFLGAAGRFVIGFVVWLVSLVARDKRAGPPGLEDGP